MLNTIMLSLFNVFLAAYGLPMSQTCGKSHNTTQADWRVVGGVDAGVGEFPWQVILTLAAENQVIAEANNFCGGSIINERWILTAGHCVQNRIESSMKIRLGVHNFTAKEEKEVNIFVEKIIPHENFFLIVNDIALIKLRESLDFNGKHSHLGPICLAKSDSKLTSRCVASGFGFINTHRQRPIGGIIQKVDEPVAENSVCKKAFTQFNETQMICAGGSSVGGKAVCNGDSGGPLQCQAQNGHWHQIGIVSFGRPCALPNTPDVFTRVTNYVDWIEKTIASNN